MSLLKKINFAILAIGIIAMTTTGCKPDFPEPDVPPQSTMAFDFSDFKDGNRTAGPQDSTDTWVHAAVNVLVWDVVIGVNLIVPVLAYGESFNHQARWKEKLGHWVWTYDFNWLVKYTAELHGWVDGNGVNWEMHISQQGGFQDVIWFSGQSAIDGNSGTWTLNKDGNNPTPYIGIVWEKNSTGDANVKYTNITPGVPGNGDYLEGGVLANDPAYDRYHFIYDASANNLIEIYWHHLNQNGKVKNPAHFGDNDWHCWDEFHVDALTCL